MEMWTAVAKRSGDTAFFAKVTCAKAAWRFASRRSPNWFAAALGLFYVALVFCGSSATAADFAVARKQVLALGKLTTPPRTFVAEGFASDGIIKPIFYEALLWRGQPTRVFAWLGIPENHGGKIPGIVLVHGGGGTAFKEWVKKWNDHGFAAISIAVEGQTDEAQPGAKPGVAWKQHTWAGPARKGIYQDGDEPLTNQWMYHAVADTVLANSLLRSLPEVDAKKVGVAGISWGGVITSTVIGIDGRFAFAVPIYGCGHMFDADNQWGRALGDNSLYREVWDPMVRIKKARMPVLWLSWPGDDHFPLDCQSACYRAARGPRMVALLPGMRHSHPAGWNPPDSYAFAESIVRKGKPWLRQASCQEQDGAVRVEIVSAKPIDRAVLISTTDTGFTGGRKWTETSAALVVGQPSRLSSSHRPSRLVAETAGGDACATILVTATLPPHTRAWFVNVRSGELTGSSDFNQCAP